MDNVRLIDVKEDILGDNDEKARILRRELNDTGITMINLMASPGAGKTSLIVNTIIRLKSRYRIAVVEADIDSKVDAEKVASHGVPAVQLRTGGFCHLDVEMVRAGFPELPMTDLDLIIVENIGNLVCPAEFDIGSTINAMILSVPEGDDKPLKYPLMFSVADIIVVNKTDMAGLSDFDMARFIERVRRINPKADIYPVSCRTGEGMDAWIKAVENVMAKVKSGKN